MISFQSSRSFSSRLTIFTGGMRRPSWKTSVASAANEPTALPPISARWPTLATNPNSSPSWKTGRITLCSGMCAPPRYGSLWSTTSPGSNDSTPSSSSVQRTMKRLAAIWAGQNSACPIMLPRRSKSTHEKSRPSLKIGEKAVRIIVMPISRQTFTKRVVERWSA